jgi:hypothetical protein
MQPLCRRTQDPFDFAQGKLGTKVPQDDLMTEGWSRCCVRYLVRFAGPQVLPLANRYFAR